MTLKNTGTTTLTSATIFYRADAGAYASFPWTGSVAAGATTTVTLPATSMTVGQSGYHVFVDSVGMPNGSADINGANNVTGVNVFVQNTDGAVLPYGTSFEATDTTYYASNTANNGAIWKKWQTGTTGVYLGHSGTYAMGFSLLDYPSGAVNTLVMPNIKLVTPGNTSLKFWVAYSQQTTSNTDKLEVVASTDCGANWLALSTISGSSAVTLPASTTAYSYPTAPTHYKSYSVSLSSLPAGSVMLGFRATNGGGNFMFVDDVNVISAVGVNEVAAAAPLNVTIFPNPVQNEATISFDLSAESDVNIQVVDAVGRVMTVLANDKMKAGAQSFTLNTSAFASGVYSVMIHTASGTLTERISVVK